MIDITDTAAGVAAAGLYGSFQLQAAFSPFAQSEAPFLWRKVVPGKRVNLVAESTLPSVYMRKKLTPFAEPRAGLAMTTALAHALIVSP